MAGQDRHLLLLGVITGPTSFDARSWQRRHYSTAYQSGVTVRYVLGNTSKCRFGAEPKALLEKEVLKYQSTFLTVGEEDCRPTAVARKTLAWYRHAAGEAYKWIGKSDDDRHPQPPHRLFQSPHRLASSRSFYVKPLAAPALFRVPPSSHEQANLCRAMCSASSTWRSF
jgi:hypothetical protein